MSTWLETREGDVPLVHGAVDPGIIGDPFAWYQSLRVDAPLCFSPDLDAYVVTRYDDVREVISAGERFSSVLFGDALLPNIFNSDDADHRRYRDAVLRHFNRRRMRAMEDGVHRHAVELAEGVAERVRSGETVDLVTEFAQRLPIAIVCEILGLPEEDEEQIAKWARAIVDVVATGLGYDSDRRAEATADLAEMGLYFAGQLEQRGARPGDDLISALVQHELGPALDEYELLLLIATLMLTGHVTTVSMLSSGLYHGLLAPGLWAETDRTQGWTEYVEEVLRFEAPLQVTVRRARAPMVLHGHQVPEGAAFYAYMGSANRDPDAFSDPEVFRPVKRRNVHLAFGGGPHFCLAAALARQEGKAAFAAMAAHLPEFALAPDGALMSTKPGARNLEQLIVEPARRPRTGPAAGLPGSVAERPHRRRSSADHGAGTTGRAGRAARLTLALARPTAPRRTRAVAAEMARLRGLTMKLGQILSFLEVPGLEGYREAFERIRDRAEPVGFDTMRAVLAAEVDPSRFERIEERPVAAASIGQVHRAWTCSGDPVAVKIQYPGVGDGVEADLRNSALLGRFLSTSLRLVGVSVSRSDVDAILHELRDRVLEELDYRQEAANQEEFRRIHRADPAIHVPAVAGELSSTHVLTSEWVDGRPWEQARLASQELRDAWGEAIFDFVFGGLYVHGMFNADPHPGNYLFHDDGRVSFLDFGCVKKFADGHIAALRECSAAVLADDMPGARTALRSLGVLSDGSAASGDAPGAPVDDWLRVLYEPLTGSPFGYSPEYGARLVEEYLKLVRLRNSGLALPSEIVMLNRINLGVHSILGGLQARADWRARLDRLIGG